MSRGALEMAITEAVREQFENAPDAFLDRLADRVVARIHADRGDELVRVGEAARLLGTTPAGIYARVKRGSLAAVRAGGGRSLRFRRADLVGGEK